MMASEFIRLPHSPANEPESLKASYSTAVDINALNDTATPAQIEQALARIVTPERHSNICALIGSDQTPGLWWLLATKKFPQARHWCYLQAEQRWCAIPVDQDPLPISSTAVSAPARVAQQRTPDLVDPEPSKAKAVIQLPAPQAKMKEARSFNDNDPRHMNDGQLIARVFLLSAWGSKPEFEREIADIEREACEGADRPDYLSQQIQKARRNGAQACALTQELESVLQQDGPDAAQQWMGKTTATVHEKIREHLHIQLKRQLERRQALQKRQTQTSQQYKSGVSVSLIDGHHPNSLRHLPPAADWSIYIDETGQIFDENAAELASTDKGVGRLVALAIPVGVKLPALKGFHGTDASGEATDKVLQQLLDAKVGILGFSVQDRSARHSYWLGHVLHIVRWVLLQLPVPIESARAAPSGCKVRVFIEQNCGYTPKNSLHILSQTLESEFRSLDVERFASLQLELAFMDKTNPFNGYVDAVAYTWGSPSALSKDRLKKSALRGHCLVESSERGLHHLYLSLSERRVLAPAEWYALCTAAGTDPAEGFLTRALEQIGQSLASTGLLWQSYLNEVHQRLYSKQYQLAQLCHAIDWLERWAPENQKLPATMQLLLLNSKLALHNHQGKINQQLLLDCLDLAEKLRDEVPQQACEAILRIATTTTNLFEFDALRDAIDHWLTLPIGIPGLLNHGKLHSTLGQIDAFTGHPSAALMHFDKALECFKGLSDPQQAQRESEQTRSYRMLCQLDTLLPISTQTLGPAAQDLYPALLDHFNQKPPEAISRTLAHSGQEVRYQHYLWLRAMIYMPEPLAGARQAYCQLQSQWQMGQDHPWPLIAAYRGWLLLDAGQHAAASEHFQLAIETCADAHHGPTLAWMAEVLRTLVQALGVQLSMHAPSGANRQALQQQLPHAAHEALAKFAAQTATAQGQIIERTRVLQHLAACLPFSFH